MRLVLEWLPGLDFPGDLSTNDANIAEKPEACTVHPVQVLLGRSWLRSSARPSEHQFSTTIWAPLRQMRPRPSCMNQASMSLQILIETASPSLAVDPRVEETHHGDGLRYRPSRASSRTTQRDRGTGPKSRQNSGCAVRPPGSER